MPFSRTLSSVALPLVVAFGLAVPALADEPPAVPVADPASRLLQLANADRAAAGLRPLAMRDDVVTVAQAHTAAMAAKATIWHNDDYFTRDMRTHLAARALGENVAFNTDLDDTHTRLMNSPGHRANIMNPGFDVVGIAVVKNGDVFYSTEDFVQAAVRAAAPTTTAPAPAAAPKPRAVAPVRASAVAKPVVAPAPYTVEVTPTTAGGAVTRQAGAVMSAASVHASPGPRFDGAAMV
ncbi:MAG TPA: CAP domain-containing protein, partial [Acidimicrobiales bacterium]|nr:CAP domain-containing protein [Acidimicrobiales bacterium]